jgi:CRISPR-associated endonuclease Cas3-HD
MADSEKKVATRIGDILSKVTLRDHTFNVARIALRLLKDTYHDPVGYVPAVIVAALGHDLGKIPEFRSRDRYAKADHPLTSVSIVEEIFEKDKDAHWLKMVAKAIGEHHQSATDQLSELLKEADGKARQQEIEQAEKRASLAWEEWFDCKELLRRVGATINVTQTGSAFRAFSVDDAVYCDPTFLYETAGAMAAEKSIIDVSLLRDTDKDKALRRIVESLRKADVLTSELGRAYTTRRYEIQVEQGKPKKMFLVPVKANAFENRAAFEEIKASHPPFIKGIIPL